MSMLSEMRKILAWVPVLKGTDSCAYLEKFARILSYHRRGEQCVLTGLTGGPAAPLLRLTRYCVMQSMHTNPFSCFIPL